ncbi:TonB-dependent siderophore receptor [Steroidobacter sp.]|uniref:TonB-dependent siderophore receptor n=1 Tax=Steroidobacter sp. TaxID=1978227 RepID=UPI001A3A92A7|nr:TonB-dependent receptor [Steroidobacter sp.]MBL8268521.1 TonB-dependent siderophore receptor [Steroidobacter sp.]
MKAWRHSALAMAVSMALLTAAPVASAQQGQQQPIALTIEAAPVGDALNELARLTGLQIMLFADVSQGITTTKLTGTYTPTAALDKLLQGTGLRYEFISANSVAVRVAQQSTSLGQSSAADQEGAIETVNVFGTLERQLSIASKSGQSLRETPKSVTVVSRERLEAQSLNSLEEALRQTTGVTLASYGTGESWFFSRGIRVQTIQFDGGAAALTGNFGNYLTPDMATYERVEMLRGVDGMFTGAGEAGGVINLVRKRAEQTPAVRLNLSTGSWDHYRADVDVTGALTDDGRLRGRAVVAYQNNGYVYDRAESEKTIVYGTTEFDLTPSTLLIGGLHYERIKEDGYYPQGTGRYNTGADIRLPRDWAYNPEWSHWYFTNKEAFLRVEQGYGQSGTVRLNLTRLEQDNESKMFYAYGALNPVTMTGVHATGTGSSNVASQNLFDLSASGSFQLLGGEHRYTLGVDYAKVDGGRSKEYTLDGYPWGVALGPAIDLFNFNPALYPEPNATLATYYPERGQTQHGIYGAITLQLLEPLRLSLGGRYGEYEYVSVSQSIASGTTTSLRYKDTAFIPSAALSWDFARDWTAYVSYAETFKPQANLLQAPLPGSPLDPVTGAGYEIGVKGELFGVLNLAVSAYRVQRDNQGTRDTNYPITRTTAGPTCCYRVDDIELQIDGFDVELSGTVLPGWQMFAGYTNTTAKFDPRAAWSYYIHMTPEHMLKLWTTYQLPGRWARVSINGGVTAQTETYVNPFPQPESSYTTGYRFTQDAYALWNAAVQYRINDTWSVGLYGENLTDEAYYQALSLGARTETVYGRPRSYMLTVKGNW